MAVHASLSSLQQIVCICSLLSKQIVRPKLVIIYYDLLHQSHSCMHQGKQPRCESLPCFVYVYVQCWTSSLQYKQRVQTLHICIPSQYDVGALRTETNQSYPACAFTAICVQIVCNQTCQKSLL